MAESANPTELLAATEVAATETTATEAPTDNESPKPEAAQDPVTENGKVASPVAPEEEKEENLPSPPKPSPPKPLSPEHSPPREVPATAPEQPSAEQTLAEQTPAEQAPAEQTSVGLVDEPEVAADPLVAEAPASATAGSEVANANGDAEKENGERVVAEEKSHEKKEEESIPPEGDSVVIPPHWHAKPCVHLTSIGGFVSEEILIVQQLRCKEVGWKAAAYSCWSLHFSTQKPSWFMPFKKIRFVCQIRGPEPAVYTTRQQSLDIFV